MWLSVSNGKLSLRVGDLVSPDPSQPAAQSWASLSRHLKEQGGRLSGWRPSWAAVPDGQAPAAHQPQAGPGAPPPRSRGLRSSFWGPLPREGAGTRHLFQPVCSGTAFKPSCSGAPPACQPAEPLPPPSARRCLPVCCVLTCFIFRAFIAFGKCCVCWFIYTLWVSPVESQLREGEGRLRLATALPPPPHTGTVPAR